MIVLAVDPSFRNTGWTAIVCYGGWEVFAAGVIRTSKADGYRGEDNHRCSVLLAQGLSDVISQVSPDLIVAESQAGSKSSKAAQLQGMGWGVLSAVAYLHDLEIIQARPQQIKKFLTGQRTASKDDIKAAVCAFFPALENLITDEISPKSKHEHAYDSVAVFLTLEDEIAMKFEKRRKEEASQVSRLSQDPYEMSVRGKAAREIVSDLEVWCDGSIEGGNPGGWAVGGWILKKDGKSLKQGVVDLGSASWTTNNLAEYAAVLWALTWLQEHHPTTEVTIYSDSKLIISQLRGEWQCSKPWLRNLRDACLAAAKGQDITWVWVPRANNREADIVSRALYKDVADMTDRMAKRFDIITDLAKTSLDKILPSESYGKSSF